MFDLKPTEMVNNNDSIIVMQSKINQGMVAKMGIEHPITNKEKLEDEKIYRRVVYGFQN